MRRTLSFPSLMTVMVLLGPMLGAQTNDAPIIGPVPNPNASALTNFPAVTAPALPAAPTPAPAPFQVAPGPQQPQTPPSEDIKDIRPPLFFIFPWLWILVVLAALVVISLLVLFWFLFRPNRQLSAKNAYELTLERLEKARAMLSEANAMAYTVLVSETIRSYLGQRFHTPSTRRTTEEFFKLMESNPSTPLAEHRLLLLDFLKRCDLIKFGRYQPNVGELDLVHQHAVNFVTATKPVPVEANGRKP